MIDEKLNKHQKEIKITKRVSKFEYLWNSYTYDGDMEDEDVLSLVFKEDDELLDLVKDVYNFAVDTHKERN